MHSIFLRFLGGQKPIFPGAFGANLYFFAAFDANSHFSRRLRRQLHAVHRFFQGGQVSRSGRRGWVSLGGPLHLPSTVQVPFDHGRTLLPSMFHATKTQVTPFWRLRRQFPFLRRLRRRFFVAAAPAAPHVFLWRRLRRPIFFSWERTPPVGVVADFRGGVSQRKITS